MHIKNVILDGFKSYAVRTDIGQFDPHFNAITGLNGSGKSNILDGIIFVLGLSSLNTVRAQNLSDLIHKGGTSVKKASASIVFDNSDKRPGKCPAGYEKFDTIIVSRTIETGLVCKYYLNGHNSTKKAIQDMFESVHLNINNPNFMIMQGKITKVVNMKPKELLHMIEETVGALSYQTKRDKSCKEIEEKDRQLGNTTKIMDEVIRPAITRHVRAARLIDEFKIQRKKLDEFSSDYAMICYFQHLKDLENCTGKLQKLETVDKNEDGKMEEMKGLITEKKAAIDEIKKESNAKVKEKLAKLEKTKGVERKKLAGVEAQFEAAAEAVEDSKGKVKSAEKSRNDELKQLEDYKKKSATLINEFTTITEDIQKAEESLKSAKDQEAELNAGKILGDDGKAINLRDRLVVVEDELGKILPNHDHEAKLITNERKTLKSKEAELARTPSDVQIERDYKAAEGELARIKRDLVKKNLKPEEFSVVDRRVEELKGELHRHEQQIRTMTRKYYYLAFNYTDPYPNFDRRTVHGCLYELFEVKDLEAHKRALDVALGGVLGNVVVETPEISRDLIKHGNIAYRTTFLPLSKINAYPGRATQNVLDAKLGRNKAIPAMDCLTYDPKYTKVVQTYLGQTVFCVDEPTAKIVAYTLSFRAITLEGDLIDPEGIMQGGARRGGGERMEICQKLRKVVLEEREKRAELKELQTKLDRFNREAALLNEYEKAQMVLKNAEDLRKCTAYAALSSEIAQLKEIIEKRAAQIKIWADEMTVWKKEQKSLTEKLDHYEESKARSMKETQGLIQKWTKSLESAKKKYDSKQAIFKDIELELNAKEAIITNSMQEIEQAKKELAEVEEECKKKKALLEEVKLAFEAKDADYEDALKEAQLLDEQVVQLGNEVENLQQQIQNIELGKMTRENSRKEMKEGLKTLKSLMDNIKKKYPNLDFSDPEKCPKPKKKLSHLKAEIDEKEKHLEEKRLRLDYNSAGKADESQAQLTTALERIAQVTKNRINIQDAIDTLDLQKAKLVSIAFENINGEFGKMMKTLLPESEAKLVPVQPGDLEAGLNIHVCLGGIWKESLSELSGGQRSLVALALVLSLCLFCPAPFYVLDEVDAALDLSHTQNIGVIIQQRFKDTQFVCVSLKDGMYSNANVLFQTSFTNGKSSVTRSYSKKK